MTLHDDAMEVFELVRAIRPLLAGRSAHVQGAVLADLLAAWLAGHVHPHDPPSTERIRKRMLKSHVAAVQALIDINFKISVEPQIKRRTQ